MYSQKLEPKNSVQNHQTKASFFAQMTMREFLFVLALATKPLYLRSSGSVQVSDLLFVLLFGLLIFRGGPVFQTPLEKKWLVWFTICLLYQFVVNLLNFFSEQTQSTRVLDMSLLKNNLYYIFNFLVCITVMQLRSLKGFSYTLRLYLTGTILSVIIAMIGVVLQYRGTGRAIGFFNNPNQLGYFCIICMSVVTFFAKDIKPPVRLFVVVICLGMTMLSLSKASIVSSTILLFAYFVNSRDRVGPSKLLSVLLSIIVVAAVVYIIMYADWEYLNSKPFIVTLRKRLGAITTENDSDLGTGRGYDRIREIGSWIITGVGEGSYFRFTAMRGKEVHSLYASFLVSYGIIGVLMMAWIITTALFTKKRYARSLLCFSGILAYCVTHNGVRSTVLWALLAMLLIRPTEEAEPEAPGAVGNHA